MLHDQSGYVVWSSACRSPAPTILRQSSSAHSLDQAWADLHPRHKEQISKSHMAGYVLRHAAAGERHPGRLRSVPLPTKYRTCCGLIPPEGRPRRAPPPHRQYLFGGSGTSDRAATYASGVRSARRPSRAAAPPSATPIGSPTWSRRPIPSTCAPRSAASGAPSGAAPARKAPVLAEAARAMALSAPEGLKGLRDRALLLLGFAGAFRRSELVALDVADLEETEDGFKIIIRRSKTDQEGHGVTIAIARGVTTCPVKAVKAWLQAAGISEGPLFRPVAKGGRLGAERLTDQSGVQHRQGLCRADRAQGGRFRRPFPARRLPDQRRPPRRLGIQDAGRVAAQVDGRAAGLCARRRSVPGSWLTSRRT